MKTRVYLKCFVNDCKCCHMDMNGFRSVTASSRLILTDCGCYRVIMVGWELLQLFLGESFWLYNIKNKTCWILSWNWELKYLKAKLDTQRFEKWRAICATLGIVSGVLACQACGATRRVRRWWGATMCETLALVTWVAC